MDLSVEGNIYRQGAFEHGCIGINEGKIVAVKKILKGDDHYDVGSQLILPAGVDIHVHFRDPGFVHKEDFLTGSQAAAYGGITCVYDMPNTRPQTVDKQTIRDKIASAQKKSMVDFGVYAGVTDGNRDVLGELAQFCSGFKIYLGETTNSLEFNENKLQDALTNAAQGKKPVLIHAESTGCLQQAKIQEKTLKDHIRSHPAACEENAIKRIIALAQKIPVKIHICHLSSLEGFEAVRKRPQHVSVGVTPHHALLSVETVHSHQTWYKVNPPIRTHFDRETLFQGLATGAIDVLESDHAPHTVDEKNTDFEQAPSGIPGVETMYPLFLAEVNHERFSLQRAVSLLCEQPADLMGVSKGRLEVGRDADFIVVDMKKHVKIQADMLHSKCTWTPFQGWPAVFPSQVFLRGEKLIEDYEMVATPGFGRFVGR